MQYRQLLADREYPKDGERAAPELYTSLAKYYDKIYSWKDYKKEAQKLKQIIHAYGRSSGNLLLDAACGTGEHVKYLRDEFQCVGIDSSDAMVAVAKSKKLGGAKFLTAGLTDFDLNLRFDVITCLFSAIGYLRTTREIRRAIHNFSRHLKPGGLLIVEPWIRKSEWKDEAIDLRTYQDRIIKIARINYSTRSGDFSTHDDRYLISEKGKGTSYVRDYHELKLFDPDEMTNVMRNEGIHAIFTDKESLAGRGLVIGLKEIRLS